MDAALVDIPVGDIAAVAFSLVNAFAAVTLFASSVAFIPVAFVPVALLAVVVVPFVVVGIIVFPIIVLLNMVPLVVDEDYSGSDDTGIRVILIEPGALGSNFWKNLKMATKALSNPNNSPYRQMEDNISKAFKQMVQNTIHPSEVAKVILQAVTSDNPDFRYVVGKDAAMIMEARKNMSDSEFQNLMKKQFNL